MDLSSLSKIPAGSIVSGVTIFGVARGVSGSEQGSFALRKGTDPTFANGTSTVFSTGYLTYSQGFPTDPWTTETWLASEVNRLQIGWREVSLAVGEEIRGTEIHAEVTVSVVASAPTCINLQISGSGDFSEPNNGVVLEPVGMPQAKSARTSFIKIPNKDGGVFQWGGADPRVISLHAVHIGDYDSAKTKRDALENLEWHTSSASWRTRPLTLSIVLGGELKEQIPVVLNDYRFEQRQGRHNIYDFDLTLTRYND